MQDLIFYNGSASFDVKVQGKTFIHSSFLSFICLFLCLLTRSFVHTENGTCRSSGITKTRLFKYIETFTAKKLKIFRYKNSDIFHMSAQNIDCGTR